MANLKINVALLMVAVLQVSAQEQRNQNIMDLTFRVLAESVQSNSTKAFENISPQCYKDTLQYVIDVAFQQTYAREMYYSSGILRQDYDLTWNLKDFGDFRMCRGAEVSVDGNAFTGKYCLSHSLIAPSSYASIAVCYPSSCTDQDIQIFVFEGVKTIPSVPSDVTTETECAVRSYQLRLQDYFAIVLCAILAAVVIAGTIYDAIQRISKEVEVSPPSPKKDEPPVTNSELAASTTELVLEEIKEDGDSSRSRASVCKEKLANALLAFSMIDAGGKILNTSPSKGSIGCLNGIRVLSMFWIILYHIWLFLALAVTYVANPRYVFEEVANRWTAELLWQGDLGVEAFFVLSGLLVSYTTLKQLDKCGGPRKHNWLLFYFHRFWRLTPAYAFVLMMYTTLTLHMGNGVHWSYWFDLQESCQKTWWANMLYIHNLYPFPGSTSECMGWTWYLSVDMQLFILSPIFIILLYKKWIVGVVVNVIATLGSLGITAYLNYALGRAMGRDPVPYKEPEYEEGAWLYTKPYYRISQYLIGITIGYVLFRLKGRKLNINKILNVIIWCCAIAAGFAIVYGTYPISQGNRPVQGVAIFYLTAYRFAFSLCIGWVIFACATGNGGPINCILSWNAWIPLARMNYCAYLTHLIILSLYTFGLEYLWYYSDFNFAIVFIGITVITYAVSFLVAMVVEIPMIGLEKVMIPNKMRKK